MSASYLRVRNWSDFQHYSDRSPPWIKLYNNLLSNYEFSCLRDASKAHLMGIWLLASQLDNRIPYDPKWIAQRVNATSPVDFKLLIESGFLIVEQDASMPLAESEQNACLETEGETEGETEKRQNNVGQQVERVFARWRELYEHPKAVLTSKRRRLIREAIRSYGVDDVMACIEGYQYSKHHMGDNDRNTVYDSIELFLRDAKHIDAGLAFGRKKNVKAAGRDWQDVVRLADTLGIERGQDEVMSAFAERVKQANERRLKALDS